MPRIVFLDRSTIGPSVELTRPFRSAYQYHNIMFMTGGETVAAASGMPWSQFVTTRIFQPLAMKSTVRSPVTSRLRVKESMGVERLLAL